ncbi:MAG TPA: asparagine synthase (glutamine-hydrolyzing) [Polyangia bacterium]|jgi:asparagine synthase (glutamine-hydrolysing)|nr:asparagine synthase (glutamine-hydrolyzing) [Polyangia bacterium]
MSAICGIVGEGASAGKGRRDVGLMLELLTQRGPDGAAIHESAEPPRPFAFGVRQLAIGGVAKTPVVACGADPKTVAVCDGQIFNTEAIRAHIHAAGRRLRGNEASELFAHLYEMEGPAGFKRVDGQFGVAIWDARKHALVLARDPLGVRALYYQVTPKGIVFASEIKALLGVPDVEVDYDPVAVSHYLTFLTVPGPRTLFKNVSKVPAGSTAIFEPGGRVDVQPYWDLLWNAIPERDDEKFYVDKVRALHDGAVARRMTTAGAPMAALVSGGNDSSANASIMARKIKEAGGDPKSLQTFTVGLESFEGDPKYNDMGYAKQVADYIGSTHHERLLTTEQFLAAIPVTIDAMDDLVSEPSAVFLHHALKMAKETGCKMVVTGEANDEISCGHGEMIKIRDRYYQRWLPFTKLPGPVKTLAAMAAPLVAPKRTDLLRRAAAGEEYFWNFEIGWPESEKASILSPAAMSASSKESASAVVMRDVERLRASEHGGRDYLNHIIYRMMQDYYFGNLMLGKLDLLSAQLGLESRCPYTEPEYAHFVYNIPAKFKQKDGMVKYFFKKAIEGILPDSIIYRPKQGFRTPVVELFKGVLGDWGRAALLDGGLTKSGFLQRNVIADLLAQHKSGAKDNSNKLWTVLVLNLWHQRWIETARPTRVVSRVPEIGASA